MNITDAAIDAASLALHCDACTDDEHDACDRGDWEREAKVALEAALPHLQPTIPTGPAGIPVYERLPVGTTLIWTDPQGRTWRGGRDDDGWWAEGYSMGMTAEQMATCGAEWTIVWSPA